MTTVPVPYCPTCRETFPPDLPVFVPVLQCKTCGNRFPAAEAAPNTTCPACKQAVELSCDRGCPICLNPITTIDLEQSTENGEWLAPHDVAAPIVSDRYRDYAAQILGIPVEDVTPELRQLAKEALFVDTYRIQGSEMRIPIADGTFCPTCRATPEAPNESCEDSVGCALFRDWIASPYVPEPEPEPVEVGRVQDSILLEVGAYKPGDEVIVDQKSYAGFEATVVSSDATWTTILVTVAPAYYKSQLGQTFRTRTKNVRYLHDVRTIDVSSIVASA